MIKFLPSYVGSKAYWIKHLTDFKDKDFIELFCGSAVISANLAKTTILNDIDPYIYKIYSNYESLIVPEVFTNEDYFKYRSQEDWWKYIYCLQKISFSGVFRYSKNGFNVPIKFKHPVRLELQDQFKIALNRFKELNPLIMNVDYKEISQIYLSRKVVVFDPPYEGSQAAYNKDFNYDEYWEYVDYAKTCAENVIIFDRKSNLEKRGYCNLQTRKMRVNGAKEGDIEAMVIL